MSAGQEGDVSVKDKEDSSDKNLKDINEKIDSNDQVDHGILGSQLRKDQIEPSDVPGSSKTDTDSGFKDRKTVSEKTDLNMDSSDEEDLHLQWEDDDEQDVSMENSKKPELDTKPSSVGLTKDNVGDIDESLDENLLLERSDEIDKMDDVITKDDDDIGKDIADDVDEDKLLNEDDQVTETSQHEVNIDSNIDKTIEIIDLKLLENANTIKETSKDENNSEKETKEINILESKNSAMDESATDENILTTSSPNESLSITIDANIDHRLDKPDAMLEIPTQEIINILDDTDVTISCTDNDTDYSEVDKTIEDKGEDSIKTNKAMNEPQKAVETTSETSEIGEKTIVINSKVFEVDAKVDNSETYIDSKTVSEDDWSEIERKLENFETSILDNKESNDEKADVEVTSSVTDNKQTEDNKALQAVLENETGSITSKSSVESDNHNKESDIEHKNSSEVTKSKISPSPSHADIVAENSSQELAVEKRLLLELMEEVESSTVPDLKKPATMQSLKPTDKLSVEAAENQIVEGSKIQEVPNKLAEQILSPEKQISKPSSTENALKSDDLEMETLDIDMQTDKESPPNMDTNIKTNESLKMDVDDVAESLDKLNDDGELIAKAPKLDEAAIESQTAVLKAADTSEPESVHAITETLPKSDKVINSNKSSTKPDAEFNVSKEISTKSNSESATQSKDEISLTEFPLKSNIEAETSSTSKLTSKESQSKIITEPSIIESREGKSSKSKSETEVLPTTTKLKSIEVGTHDIQPSTSKAIIDVKPSTSASKESNEANPTAVTEPSHQAADSSEEVEVTDSLGLLAESSRVMEDDEEQEEDDDDDDDFYPEDESSNQMTAEHSEDSNPHNSETDAPKELKKEIDTESLVDEKRQENFSFDAGEEKKEEVVVEKDANMEVDDVVCGDVAKESIQKIEVTTEDDKAQSPKVSEADTKMDHDKETGDPGKPFIETVKLSDTSDTEAETESRAAESSLLKNLLTKEDTKTEKPSESPKTSPSKRKLGLAKPGHVLNIVDLEESSEEDDIQEVKKVVSKQPEVPESGTSIEVSGTNVTIPAEIEVKTVSASEEKVEPATTTEITESSATASTSSEAAIPDAKASEDTSKKHRFTLEIFNLDSDEEDSAASQAPRAAAAPVAAAAWPPAARGGQHKCMTPGCASGAGAQSSARRRAARLCEPCQRAGAQRARNLVEGIKELKPLLDLDIDKESTDLVEISDSDSEEETDDVDTPKETIGETGAAFIEAKLAKAINETWLKFKMDSRLTEAQDALNKEMEKLDEETKEIDAMLDECQVATDQLRNDLYATFELKRHELNALVIYDTPTNKYICLESALNPKMEALANTSPIETRAKRRMSSAADSAAKRAAIPLGYAPLDRQESKLPEPTVETMKADDDKDISVLKVSVEAAPVDLPPPGELSRAPLRADMCVYAMRNAFGSWARARVLDVQPAQPAGATQTFTMCRVKLFSRNQQKMKLLPARCLAYPEPASVRMTIGTRVIALFKDPNNVLKRDTYYSGIVAEVPNPVNNYRYLVFFDDGYAQYVSHADTRVVCECSPLVWEEVHPFSREFVRKYLIAYPERPMVRLHAGQSLKTEWNGKWWPSRVVQVDASLVQVHFEEDNRTEWIYRGSTRLAPLYLELQAAERHRARPMPRTKAQARVNMPYVEYTRSDEQNRSESSPPQPTISAHEREIRQRAVAKKSTAAPPPPPAAHPDSVTSRVVYYTPKKAVKPYKMIPHTCGPQCKRKDTLALKDLRTYNPLAKPLLSGWERQIVRYNGNKEVMYRAPCGRRLRSILELHRYLRAVQSDMAVDLFDFTPQTHCLAEFVLNKCLVGKKDLSYGKENVPVPCVNYYDESLPEICSYNTERTPTAGVPLNLDPEFLCGCDCTDDCEDKSKCACWKMTLEGARTIGLNGNKVGYVYKRLPEPLPSGIYECNSRCKCKQTCLNRVAQHPLQLKLQVFKTLNRGWGIRALNDVPKGSFLCVYAGNLLTDATANMDGLNEGDEYLAELDYIEVVEQMKEGYEEDIPDADKRLDKKNIAKPEEEAESSSEEEEELPSKNEKEDDDFCPGYIGLGVAEFSKRLRKRDKNKKEKEEKQTKEASGKEKESEKADEDCITISDDEEVREPSRFMAEAGMESSEFVSKYRSVRSYFGKDEACYIMDAKVQGNIGRYLNHSCMPNVFVQNVFVDTHDPRFPWVAFFALSHIKAGTELTWNYNYDVGSVPGKTLYCYCGAPNCRGRLL